MLLDDPTVGYVTCPVIGAAVQDPHFLPRFSAVCAKFGELLHCVRDPENVSLPPLQLYTVSEYGPAQP